MKKPRIYVDTSVIGGCCDPEFQEWSNSLLNDFQQGVFELILSEIVDAEIQDAPYIVKEVYKKFRSLVCEVLEISTEVIELADAYIKRGILSENFRDDARHIAIATVGEVDLLVSWNFRHIVHFEKIRMFNAVNIEMGYKTIMIYSPREVTRYDSESS